MNPSQNYAHDQGQDGPPAAKLLSHQVGASGQRIGLTRQMIAAIEAEKYSPSLEAAFRIAQVFNVPLGEVFRWDAKATPLRTS